MATSPFPETGHSTQETKVYLSFGVGTVGSSIVLNTVAVYFPAMMSTVFGISPAVVGTMLMLSKVFDAFADIYIGHRSDNHASPIGRRRPFLLLGSLVAFVALLGIFLAPEMPANATIAYMAVALVVHAAGYSLFNVPYLAMPAEMTDSYSERLKIISYRTAFIGLGQVMSLAATAGLISLGGGGADGYRLMGVVMAIAAFVSMIACYFGTASAPFLDRGEGHARPTIRDIISLRKSRPLVMLLSAKLSQYIAFGIIQSANLLFVLNVLKAGYGGMVHMMVAQNAAVFVSMPLWVRIGNAVGKRNSYLVSIAILLPTAVSWYWALPGLPMWEIWLRSIVWGIGSGGALLMSTSMLPDATEFDRLQTRKRREGIISSIYSINEKLGFAIGALVMGYGLSLGGYVPSTGGRIVEQSASAIGALYAIKAFIPTIVLIAGLVFVWLYDIDDAKLRRARAAAGGSGGGEPD